MAKEAPSFSRAEYWDKRFQDNTKAFDWLLPESCFDEELEELLRGNDVDEPARKNVLHIGPGTSLLSFHLKTFLGARYRIHNVDFSHEAVDWGKSKENELSSSGETGSLLPVMQWSQVSLLSLPSILSAAAPGSINLVVDKSTSDAIACGLNIRIQLPQPSEGHATSPAAKNDPAATAQIHPLHILALNLAVVAAPRARWLTLSYSKERYPFLPTLFVPFADPLPDGVPNPNRYWKLKRQREVQTEQELPEKFRKAFDFVHRPAVSHYLYVLERTEEELSVADAERLAAQVDGR